jgi:hypothetical protein
MGSPNSAASTNDILFSEEFISSQHESVIKGITRVYETLLKMQYIEASEIHLPPHADFPSETLMQIGIEPEVVALLRQLPYLDIEGEITAYTNAYSYLDDVKEARQVTWEGENDLAPWAIRLSKCKAYPGVHGRTIIYDLRTRSIVQWFNNEPGYTNTYLDLPHIPPGDFFEQWLGFLKDLTEIPWRSAYTCGVSSVPPAPPSGCVDLVANGYSEDVGAPQGDGYNLREAQKKIYRNHGWPDEFRGEEFRATRQSWQLQHNMLDKARSTAMHAGNVEEKRRTFEAYSAFLENSAGGG